MAMLHALWDASGSVAYWLTLLLTGTPMQWTLIGQGEAPAATQTQVHVYTVVNWSLLLLDAVIGVAILIVRWRRATVARPQPAPAVTDSPAPADTAAALSETAVSVPRV
jgi:hypothetical protein